MEKVLTLQMHNKYWWLNILLGIFFIGTGFWFCFTPIETFITLAIYFSIWMFVSGFFEIINAISASKHSKQWGFYLVGGIVDIAIGGILMAHENLTMEILPLFLGFWFLFRAFLGIAMYYELKNGPKAVYSALLITALLSAVIGLVILAKPGIGELSIVYMTAFAFIFIGIYRLILGLQQRQNR